ncbi:rootletin-like [Aricia agestis]|uniref:rootletin-like n=1 Tax=Aricia agestis TaxID=91739 RepID=UPI001C2060B7|nr:rootletin-like [Aricia agestis]
MPKGGGKRQGGVEDEGGGSDGGGEKSSDGEFVAFYGDHRTGDEDILEEVRKDSRKDKREGRNLEKVASRSTARAGITLEEILGTESIPSMSESELVATKRLFSELSGSDTEGAGAGSDKTVKPQVAKRGKSRSSTSRLSAARQDLRERTKEAKEADFLSSLDGRSFRKEVTELAESPPPGPLDIDVEAMGPEDLLQAAEKNLQEIVGIANKSSNLKGGYANKIRRATSAVRLVLDALGARTEAEETRRLKADNNRLQRELANLREEVRAYKREFEESRTEAAKEKRSPMSSEQLGVLERNVARLVGNLVDKRLAALEERLPPLAPIRPPLAADRRRAAAQEKGPAHVASSAPVVLPSQDLSPVVSTPVTRRVEREEFPALPVRPEVRSAPAPKKVKGKAKGSKSRERTEAGSSASASAVTASSGALIDAPAPIAVTANPTEESSAGWTEVVRRKAPKKKEPMAKPVKKAPKVVMPRSTAVVVKLKPEAICNGSTYSSVLQKAEVSIKLDELGIGPLRIRQAATGARVIEIPGSTSHDKADSLAARLAEVLAEEVEVSRPVKCADFKITGLSDAATVDSVKSAVAREGECLPTQIWVGEIQRGLVGTGFARMSCPVTAAKKLVSLGSIAVGWSKVTLHLVNARPKHCFRCLGMGHFAALCPPSMKDRSNLCYRCGQSGHNASGCVVAKPKCAVCSDAGRPAEHVMGGRSCNPPPVRGKIRSSLIEGRGLASPEAQMSD